MKIDGHFPNDLDKKMKGLWVMGGLGSGNRYRFDKKDTVEDYDSLDVRSLKRKGLLELGCYGSLS